MLDHPDLQRLAKAAPFLWLNGGYQQTQSKGSELSLADMQAAEQRLQRFAPLLQQLFPELSEAKGLIESALLPAPKMQQQLASSSAFSGTLLIKADHQLPVAGSIKARGGIYEVLCFAEALALEQGLLSAGDNYGCLLEPAAKKRFSEYQVSVGSTGNLGLSIGLMAAALGFKASVHMSVEAKAWKKQRLRQHGVEVIEHSDDYSRAVAAGRQIAADDPKAYFVDDENSRRLFLGYSVAALRLQRQLQAQGIRVDAEHPLMVYLPCGVGGAPGGICFGLKQLFGDFVHCFFAEPTQAPCMLLGMASEFKDDLSVYDLGLSIHTEADGLAVGQASAFVGGLMQPLLSGIYTVSDAQMFKDLKRLYQSEGHKIEPSAAAGFSGPDRLLNSPAGASYLEAQQLQHCIAGATHLVWTTGGSLVPDAVYRAWLD